MLIFFTPGSWSNHDTYRPTSMVLTLGNTELLRRLMPMTLKNESCQYASFVVIGGTDNDNLWCDQWRQSWYDRNCHSSVISNGRQAKRHAMITPPSYKVLGLIFETLSQVARFMGPTWGPPGSCRPLMGPMNLVIRVLFAAPSYIRLTSINIIDGK